MSAFGDAFKAARAAGKKTFTFNGKSYHTRTKEEEAKAKAKPKSDSAKNDSSKPKSDAAKPMPKSEFMDLLDRNNPSSKYMKKLPDNRPPAKDATFSSKGASERKPEIIKPVDKSPKKIGEDGKLKNVNPVDMPERRRLGPRTEAPEIIKTSDKKDDTSLSVSERIKRAKDRARTSDTGTDKRSVNQRFKDAAPRAANILKSAVTAVGDAISPTASMTRRAREAAEKEMGKGMKRGGTVRGDGIAKRGKTKGRMC